MQMLNAAAVSPIQPKPLKLDIPFRFKFSRASSLFVVKVGVNQIEVNRPHHGFAN
jgi:hypothetical protein